SETFTSIYFVFDDCMPWVRTDECILQTLVIALAMVQLSNTTPILLTFVKSAIRGIRGMAGQCGCMPVS
ncbi:MAG TPA: hypothetical protein VKB58_03550, partial [Terriglobales bacterium]|nr:hypothetical protein [Terriglobales bacterium]